MAGRPASSAYAIPWGTRSVVRTRPATRSLPSRTGRYDRSIASPGTACERTSRREVPSDVIAVLLLAGHLAALDNRVDHRGQGDARPGLGELNSFSIIAWQRCCAGRPLSGRARRSPTSSGDAVRGAP